MLVLLHNGSQSIFIFLLDAVVVEVLLVVALMSWVVAADSELFLFYMYIFNSVAISLM